MTLASLVITFFSLIVANTCSALMVQAENRNRPHLAGIFEAGWGVLYFVAAKFSLGGIGGHGATQTCITIGVLIVGNYVGGYIGTKVGERFVRDFDELVIDDRLSETEAALVMAEQTLHELNQEIMHHHDHEGHDHS